MAGMAALKALLSKGGDEGLSILKVLGAKGGEVGKEGLGKLDMMLGKVPGMVSKTRADLPVAVGADPARRNALLAGLGLGGAGLGAAALGGEEDDDEGMGKLKSLLGL